MGICGWRGTVFCWIRLANWRRCMRLAMLRLWAGAWCRGRTQSSGAGAVWRAGGDGVFFQKTFAIGGRCTQRKVFAWFPWTCCRGRWWRCLPGERRLGRWASVAVLCSRRRPGRRSGRWRRCGSCWRGRGASRAMSARRRYLPPLVPLYAAGLRWKKWLLSAGRLKRNTLNHVVISVGSLSAGGAGKTPVVLMLADILRRRAMRCGF